MFPVLSYQPCEEKGDQQSEAAELGVPFCLRYRWTPRMLWTARSRFGVTDSSIVGQICSFSSLLALLFPSFPPPARRPAPAPFCAIHSSGCEQRIHHLTDNSTAHRPARVRASEVMRRYAGHPKRLLVSIGVAQLPWTICWSTSRWTFERWPNQSPIANFVFS